MHLKKEKKKTVLQTHKKKRSAFDMSQSDTSSQRKEEHLGFNLTVFFDYLQEEFVPL